MQRPGPVPLNLHPHAAVDWQHLSVDTRCFHDSVMEEKLEVILVKDRSRGLKHLQTLMDGHPVVVNPI